jgi:hypothetical protein
MLLGNERVFARTDGGLQIEISRKDSEGNELGQTVTWERAYYELALEVFLIQNLC